MARGWEGDTAGHRAAALKGWAARRRGGYVMSRDGVIMPRRGTPPARPARAARPAPAKAKGSARQSFSNPKPVWRPQGERFAGIDPFAAPDPYQLRAQYGDEQLERVLGNYTPYMLRKTTAQLGIKASGNSKIAIVHAIAGYVQREPITRTRERFQRVHDARVARFARSADGTRPPLNVEYGITAPARAARPAPAKAKASTPTRTKKGKRA